MKKYTVIELFAGAGGLAIGMESAGLKCLALNEFNHWAAETLRINRPNWNVIEGDIRNLSFLEFEGKADVVTGGFPCQAFSYAGKQLGFKDARGTLFYEFARVVKETKPKICVGENVKGLTPTEVRILLSINTNDLTKNNIIVGNASNKQSALQVDESTIVGRLIGEDVKDLSVAEVRTLLN